MDDNVTLPPRIAIELKPRGMTIEPADIASMGHCGAPLDDKNVTPIGSQPGAFFPGYSTREQLAHKVGRTPETIKKWEKKGLRVYKRGNLRLYNDDEVRRWILGELAPLDPRPVGRPRKHAG